MEKTHYTISEAAKEVHVDPHVLRYWEEELSLAIPRNPLGHRVYGKKELALLRQIIQWKKEGLSLKEIENKCNPVSTLPTPAPHNNQILQYPSEKAIVTEDFKMQQFKKILGRIVTEAIQENSNELTTDIASNVATSVTKELDYLFREKEEADEKRFRHLDETIRSYQKARQEAAAAEMTENKSKNRHFFGKK
ncbi:MAG: MerR family transcriptional regulator [Lachnospiraceae bacterium]|nr:MerR family transcriptional regulator [Lachnospiraceae bacterium]